ncbi:uncharacterized protein [Triticum aestivum]|uniref:uncharacterized protein n=1 Tax=Triticum aestivum TaxID=4565 RepID=UPI001D00C07C|nr:uncharacterized protein LOC123116444 [Triticum aestivum]
MRVLVSWTGREGLHGTAAAAGLPLPPASRPCARTSPPADRTAPRSLSTSLSVVRPRVHRCDSDPERASDDAGVGLPSRDPTVDVECHYHVAAMDLSDDTDAGLVLGGPAVVEPHELAANQDQDEPRYVTETDLLDDLEDDEVVYPLGLNGRELRELRDTDFSRDAIDERFRRESKEAKAAVIGAVTGVVRPLRELLDDVRRFKSVVDTQEFHIGMPFGAIMTCMGLYQLWKLSPSTCIEVAMYYAFYKLSAIAADVRRRGFSPDWIIRIKLGIIIAVLVKDLGKAIVPLDYVRCVIFFIYSLSVAFDVQGVKKFYAKMLLPVIFHMAKHPMETEPQWKRVKPTGQVKVSKYSQNNVLCWEDDVS